MNKREIIIVTSSYGADYIKKIGGQAEVLKIIKEAGADGVEIRRELFSSDELSALPHLLPSLAEAVAQQGLICFYSVPFALFTTQGDLNRQIEDYFQEAKQLNAKLIKFSLGHFQNKTAHHFVPMLKKILDNYPQITLAIENDQQEESGTLAAMQHFAKWVQKENLAVKLAFDVGNWSWLKQDASQAANKLATNVGYIHVKSTALDASGKRIAVPPAGEDDDYLQIIRQHLPMNIPRGIEFPLYGNDLIAVSKYFVDLLRE